MSRPLLNIVGAGKAASALARLWVDGGVLRVGGVCNRSVSSAEAAAAFIGAGRPVEKLSELPAADAWLVGCPDRAIAAVAAALGTEAPVHAGSIVFHLSGALDATAVTAAGGRSASFHPARSFADPNLACREFAGTLVAVEGDERACLGLAEWARAIGDTPFAVEAGARTLYHAASAMASNYTVTLTETAADLYRSAGIDASIARKLATSLARGAIDNVERLGGPGALTGPIARGDVETVRTHLGILPADYRPLYRTLGRVTLRLARAGPDPDGAAADAIAKLLDEEE